MSELLPSHSEEPVSFCQKMSNLLSETGGGFKELSTGQKLFLGATAIGLAFEWGMGNEAYLGIIGGTTYDITHSNVLTGLATGTASFAEQAVLGLAMVANIKNMPGFTESVRNNFFPSFAEKVAVDSSKDKQKAEKMSLGTRFILSFALGASAVVLTENVKDTRTVKENVNSVLESAGLIGGGVATIAFLAATITNIGEKLGYHDAAHTFVNIIKNPLTYAGLFAAKLSLDKVRKTIKNHKNTPGSD